MSDGQAVRRSLRLLLSIFANKSHGSNTDRTPIKHGCEHRRPAAVAHGRVRKTVLKNAWRDKRMFPAEPPRHGELGKNGSHGQVKGRVAQKEAGLHQRESSFDACAFSRSPIQCPYRSISHLAVSGDRSDLVGHRGSGEPISRFGGGSRSFRSRGFGRGFPAGAAHRAAATAATGTVTVATAAATAAVAAMPAVATATTMAAEAAVVMAIAATARAAAVATAVTGDHAVAAVASMAGNRLAVAAQQGNTGHGQENTDSQYQLAIHTKPPPHMKRETIRKLTSPNLRRPADFLFAPNQDGDAGGSIGNGINAPSDRCTFPDALKSFAD